MESALSFAPLAARLAARVDETRPVDGAEATWANFMALFFCAILQMLILLCEALDARAAADAALMAAPARREGAARPVAGRAPRLALVPDVQTLAPQRDAVLSGTAGPAPVRPWRAWSRHVGRAWAVADPPTWSGRETRLCVPRPSTPILLLYRNKLGFSSVSSKRGRGWFFTVFSSTSSDSRMVA